jgi:cold-inducible RNA-binding protein
MPSNLDPFRRCIASLTANFFAVSLLAKLGEAMKNIFVGNLNFQMTEDALRTAFERFGEVTKVKLVTDRETGRARGFAFVEMADDEQAAHAISELNGQSMEGRTLTVNEARPKSDRPFSRDGGHGGGFGQDDSMPFRRGRESRW